MRQKQEENKMDTFNQILQDERFCLSNCLLVFCSNGSVFNNRKSYDSHRNEITQKHRKRRKVINDDDDEDDSQMQSYEPSFPSDCYNDDIEISARRRKKKQRLRKVVAKEPTSSSSSTHRINPPISPIKPPDDDHTADSHITLPPPAFFDFSQLDLSQNTLQRGRKPSSAHMNDDDDDPNHDFVSQPKQRPQEADLIEGEDEEDFNEEAKFEEEQRFEEVDDDNGDFMDDEEKKEMPAPKKPSTAIAITKKNNKKKPTCPKIGGGKGMSKTHFHVFPNGQCGYCFGDLLNSFFHYHIIQLHSSHHTVA